MKRILLFTMLALLVAVPAMADRKSKLKRRMADIGVTINEPTVSGSCGNQTFNFSATVKGDTNDLRWMVDGQPVTSTMQLSPGDHKISVEAGEGNCTAYHAINFKVDGCPEPVTPTPTPTRSCFTDGSVSLTKSLDNPSQGEIVTIFAAANLAGGNYGDTRVEWFAEGGKVIESNNTQARIDLTNAQPGQTVTVRYKLSTEINDCGLSDAISFTLPVPPPVVSRTPIELTPCTSFKLNQVRVDNACKAILEGVARQLQSDPMTRIVLTGTYRKGEKVNIGFQRAANIRAVLTKAGIMVSIDENRVSYDPPQSGDGRVIIKFIP